MIIAPQVPQRNGPQSALCAYTDGFSLGVITATAMFCLLLQKVMQ